MIRRIRALAVREFMTVARRRSYRLFALAVTIGVVGFVAVGGSGTGYLPTAADLRIPMELLAPLVALAVGYSAIAADASRGELDVLKTYDLSPWTYVIGVYLGRAVATVAILVVPLVAAGVYAGTADAGATQVLATHQGADSPALFVRFMSLTALFAVVVLAIVLAASAVAWARQTALVGAIGLVLGVLVGGELLLVAGVDWFGDALPTALALSPASAYRGLVFEYVLSTALSTQSAHISSRAAIGSLCAWLGGGLMATVGAVSRA